MSHPDRLLRMTAVLQIAGFGRSCLYRTMAGAKNAGNRFPRPVKLGRVSAWPESEVLAWIERQKAQRDTA